jgi:COMPASS component SWD1
MRTLEGPKESVRDMAWHPTRPIVVSVAQNGVIYLWAKEYQENWSAFAPDFKELQENDEYDEREDEFDSNPREDEVRVRGGLEVGYMRV